MPIQINMDATPKVRIIETSKIKNRVRHMIEHGRSEAYIDRYLDKRGLRPEDLKAKAIVQIG